MNMNLFKRNAYLAEVNRAGAQIEAGEAKGLQLLLHDVHTEVLDLRASQEEHMRRNHVQGQDLVEELQRVQLQLQRVLVEQGVLRSEQGVLRGLLGSTSDGNKQAMAEGLTETVELMAAAVGQGVRAQEPSRPRLGLITGWLHQLDLWALQLFLSHGRA